MYGDSIYAYYQKQRLQKAKALLQSGAYTIKEAALAVGYNNIANFTLAFKKQYKTMPRHITGAV
jgi:AraC-like DNA-binding protein